MAILFAYGKVQKVRLARRILSFGCYSSIVLQQKLRMLKQQGIYLVPGDVCVP